MSLKWKTDHPDRTYVRSRNGTEHTFGIQIWDDGNIYIEITFPAGDDKYNVLNIIVDGDDFANAIAEQLRKQRAGS